MGRLSFLDGRKKRATTARDDVHNKCLERNTDSEQYTGGVDSFRTVNTPKAHKQEPSG